MADQFRDQVNTARRAGYSDEEIAGYLIEKRNPSNKVKQALDEGYKPAEILQYLAPALSMGEEAVRKVGVGIRGANEALAPIAAGAGAGFLMGGPVGAGVGALAGGLAAPVVDAATMAYNKLFDGTARTPSSAISEMLPGPRAETPVERVIQSSAGALGGTAGAISAGRGLAQMAKIPTAAGTLPTVAPSIAAIGQEASRLPIGQLVTAPLATGVGQTVSEATESPLAGLVAGVATGGVAGVRPVKRGAVPTAEELLAQSKANYDILDKSGFQLDNTLFKQHMASLPAKLRSQVGYVESVNPKVAGAFKELLSDAPKDVAEITALRKIIGGAAGSADKSERMVAMKLLDEFDTYVLNASPSAIISGDAKAMQAWKDARADYAKVKKSELIEDIVARAEVSQSGKELTIAQGLSALAKNDRKMRFFTADEQEAIREAAKSGTLQNLTKIIGKFSPTTPAAAIFTAVNPYGAYTAAAGMAAKELSTAQRMQQINALSARMRLGGTPPVLEGATANVPTFLSRGIVNNLGALNQSTLLPSNQNALAK
jgi:hypothetical protein